VLTETVTVPGIVTAARSISVTASAPYRVVTVTSMPVRPGDRVWPGHVIAEIDGRPVLLLQGRLPAYRDLHEGDAGPDVRQLQEALGRLGYPDFDPAGLFGPSTALALLLLYQRLGYDALFVSDHLCIPPDQTEGSGGRYLDVLATLAYLAGATERIRLGISVMVLPFRPAVFTAKLIDAKRRREFEVVVLPNLYGDIVTDEAAELQGGVGTAGSANIGARFGMFEAIHGSAPRMITEGRGAYADPLSLMRAAVMMLEHVGMVERSRRLARALDLCAVYEPRVKITGRADGATATQFGDEVIAALGDPGLDSKWESHQTR
jgi:hypothetical protein